MSTVDRIACYRVLEEVVKPVVKDCTRVAFKAEDFSAEMKINDGKWIIEIVPVTDYGELAMKKIFEKHTTEELKQG